LIALRRCDTRTVMPPGSLPQDPEPRDEGCADASGREPSKYRSVLECIISYMSQISLWPRRRIRTTTKSILRKLTKVRNLRKKR
jgi:hypothetical protein